MQKNRPIPFTLFYDDTCPLCVKKMSALKKRDTQQRLQLIPLGSEQAKANPALDCRRAKETLHGLTPDHQWLLGLDALHQAWSLVGVPWLYGPLRWHWVRPLAERAYAYFARHRYRISKLLTGLARCFPCESQKDAKSKPRR
ncbi:DUF393 domain-containing protein [Vibrio sp. SM6]|uniref:DUF393 domain-containing protein n=1 Tax=Vibrio agarilyticus TaxID=2726741 RepID=A0A7X8TNQ0_9VIBR|nr:DUF393 domain-containing protein [Vibrio agarilyticus]NLS11910.1 DUF393 domain-containing protein [Vibrio agarilyticus]